MTAVKPGIRLRYEAPFDWAAMLAFFGARAVPGVERLLPGAYLRTIDCAGDPAVLEMRDEPHNASLVAVLHGGTDAAPDDLALRLRRMFDLDADIAAIATHFSRDPVLAPMVATRPAVRVPGHWDPFETAMRAVLGQQVSIERARMLNARLVERAGRVISPALVDGGPHRLFPAPREVLAADLSDMGMPRARIVALTAVAEAALADPGLFRRSATVEETVARLCAIKGVGPWTAQYIAIRACREPDAFPASDVGLLRGSADAEGRRPSPAELTRQAEAWRPWRAYAAQHLWAHDEARTVETKRAPKGR
ncbi:MAG: DNA-3-methyladenine glycosylase family protein [Gammaproteobacteria bacterium]